MLFTTTVLWRKMLKLHTDFIVDFFNKEPLYINKLKGDASERMYFRVTMPDKKTYILMQDTDNPEKNSIKNYISLTEILLEQNVKVPEIFFRNTKQNLLLIEDGGDISLWDACHDKSQSVIINLYKKAIDEMIKIHNTPPSQKKECFSLAFDTEKLMWELDFFLKHVQKGVTKFTDDDMLFFRQEFTKICNTLSQEDRVLTHRDYHSRNIMVNDDNLLIIDFQDARMGPAAYDMCSLLKDSYIDLDKHTIEALIDYYCTQKNFKDSDKETFMKSFNLMTFQRSIKACGSFCYLEYEKNKKGYMQHFPTAVRYAQDALCNFPQYKELIRRFFTYFK